MADSYHLLSRDVSPKSTCMYSLGRDVFVIVSIKESFMGQCLLD
jgi:hypothetical protein